MRYTRSTTTTEGVIRVINALYADFNRREAALGAGHGAINRFRDLNNTLRAAVDSTCEASIRDGMFFDLCHDIGYEKSSLAIMMSHKTYYARKKAAKLDAAARLGLIDRSEAKSL